MSKPDHTLHNLLFNLTAAKNELYDVAVHFSSKSVFGTSAQTRLHDAAKHYAYCQTTYDAAVSQARKEGK
ncbi:MAG: hypothetical protein WCS52_00660 [bacterium]